jgi:hypothetical protein
MRSRTSFRAVVCVLGLVLAACAGSGRDSTDTSHSSVTTPSGGSPTGGGGSVSPTEQPVPSEGPVPAENNPPGDIPDDTAFVPYRAAGGFKFVVPEGWARTSTHSTVTFSDKLNSISAGWFSASSAPTVSSARQTDVPDLQKTERAFRLQNVTSVSLPSGAAVLIVFQENSAPNKVTGKQYRLDVQRFELYHGGTEAVLTLSSPVGADNVDPWRIVSESLAWS